MFPEDLVTVARQLVAHCRNGTEEAGLAALYSPDAVSVEAAPMPGASSPVTEGVEGIRAKHDWWKSSFEVHGSEVDGPYLHGPNRFAVIFSVDATNRATGERSTMREIGVYTVGDGQIVREDFFYAAP